ncbi:hypothetical protein E6P09_06585 [Haloferax mediterranei ATCC 33500]|uniref:Uncharacterized protein n=1 Tax=Haloferax mediterranei (strain ATCC 33500 / DSM 1411 / JCM 8866 / NBRC 14739 / NCIMB 2177 / R-4) TaxID=523841 RepID=I3R2H1_HALMT|nr:hypothetical protein [Haloferax mediterranei]AFK18431.1 hypothetical protein HFX_0708 [Haloferax mediterranei ATCC 33500]AHZ22179.1 hypothetical protein BM92_05690 [Haloferax mediterranei ATCC 33500]EMA02292.1 hypothetical protein C439_06915 [Haloferax mediterranei ATCC 33500]MDX5988524.1 hypothetical protein [Haloferax mediterranei ATCC 33500]QCQ74940.1 hypothetical protein E6P09_06585 [Haloferax mediterranei ATCC 33500]
MLPSSQHRAQTSPVAALTALFVVCAALSGYATVLDRSLPTADRDLAPATLENVESTLADDTGTVNLSRISSAPAACPDGYSCRIVVAVDDERRVVGPDAPAGADSESTRVSVRIEPGRVGFGTLRVEVWQ